MSQFPKYRAEELLPPASGLGGGSWTRSVEVQDQSPNPGMIGLDVRIHRVIPGDVQLAILVEIAVDHHQEVPGFLHALGNGYDLILGDTCLAGD